MDNEIENNDYESDLEQSQDGNRTRKLQAFVMLVGGAILTVILLYMLFSSFTKDGVNSTDPEKEKKEKRKEAKKKEFSFALPKPKEAENKPKKPFPIAAKIPEKLEFKPKIIKGVAIMAEGRTIKDIGTEQNKTYKGKTISQELGIKKDTDSSFVGDTFSPSSASVSQFDPNFVLPKGSMIECSLNTRLVSQIKGGISCTVSNNIYSSNGNVLLIERGSKITGMFKAGQLNDGMNRLFVVWQEIRTLNNLVIPVFSGAADPLGGSGIVGEVDHHWMVRFGSAILLSAIDDALNILAYNLNNKNNNNQITIDYSESSRKNAQEMASIALENFIKIKPTLYKNHGDLVAVYVNRDIDFSKVYSLKYHSRLKK